MIKAVIFDLNGVFVRSRFLSERFEERYGVPHNEFWKAMKPIMDKVRKPGAGDTFQYWEPVFRKWGLTISRDEFFNFWFSGERPDAEMIDLGRKAKNKAKLLVLSKNFKERTAYYRKNFDFLKELFEKVYFSWETGFVKPDQRAFELLLKENGLLASECLFFDDHKENIEMARRLGMEAHFFISFQETKKVLEKHNIV